MDLLLLSSPSDECIGECGLFQNGLQVQAMIPSSPHSEQVPLLNFSWLFSFILAQDIQISLSCAAQDMEPEDSATVTLLKLGEEMVSERKAEFQSLLDKRDAHETAARILMFCGDLRKILEHKKAAEKGPQDKSALRSYAEKAGMEPDAFESDLEAGIFRRPLKKKRTKSAKRK